MTDILYFAAPVFVYLTWVRSTLGFWQQLSPAADLVHLCSTFAIIGVGLRWAVTAIWGA